MSRSKILVVSAVALATLAWGTVGCSAKNSGGRVAARAKAGGTQPVQVVQMAVTADGFVPAQAQVRAGQPVKLVITRKTDRTCATDIVIKDYQIHQPLPLNRAVEVTFVPTRTGTVRYACAMDMVAGALTVK